MRIALTGTHGIGKTTLAKQLSERLGIPYLDEVARKVARIYGFENSNQVKESSYERIKSYQLDVWANQIKEERKNYSGFISCRSVLDAIAYSIYYNGGITDTWLDVLNCITYDLTADYDVLVYCPIPDDIASPTDDGFRLMDRDSQIAVDCIIQGMLPYAKAKKVCKLSNKRDWWLNDVLPWLGKF